MTGHQHAVFRDHQVGFDEVRARLDGNPVRFEGVLGARATAAPVTDHDGVLAFQGGQCRQVGRADGRFQQFPVGTEVQQVGAELVPDPQGAVGGKGEAFHVEVSAGQQALGAGLVHDLPRHFPVRVTQGNEVAHLHGAALGLFFAWRQGQVVQAQEVIGAVVLRAEAVVA